MVIKVTGIGGLFFRAADPDALARWYADLFGIPQVADDYVTPPWRQDAGATVFAPFATDTDYFAKPQAWMFNLRVADLDQALAELHEKGIEVTVDPKTYPNGRFARIKDPEGNPIELWEPAGPYL